ncbi:MAG TPA: OsmC family protein [Candidatus Limnocylindria bacterium]|nr:OsmC family protein [Candidatus Limnocylindria bacterium]
MSSLNGMDPADIAAAIAEAKADPARSERHPHLVAEWTGADRSRVRIDGKTLDVSGPGHLDAMQLVLAAYAACIIELIATHATLMGLTIRSLELELDAHFDVRAYLGLEGPAPGYDRLGLTARLCADGITDEQAQRLQEWMERASPVGATLAGGLQLRPRLEIVREPAAG